MLKTPEIVVPLQEDAPYPISPRGTFTLEFSHRMKKGSVEANVRIEPLLPYQSLWQGRSFFLKPKIPLIPDTSYRITISKSAESLFGIPFTTDQAFSFIVGEEPHVISIMRSNPNTDDTPHYLSILFSHPMVNEGMINQIVLPDFLRFSPSPSGNWSWINSKTLVFRTDTGFSPETRYALRSTKTMTAFDQSSLLDKIDLTFDPITDSSEPQEPITPFSELRKDKLSWSDDASFFRFAMDEKDLALPFRAEDMDELTLTLCQLSLDQVVRIDLRTFRRWEAFTPSASSCQRYESMPILFLDSDSPNHQLILPKLFPNLEKGLYYLRLTGDDREQMDTLMEYASISALVKRGASALVYVINANKMPIPEAQVRLYSHSGSLLQIGRTDRDGLFVIPQNRLLFEYVGVLASRQELFINIFSSSEYDSERFGVSENQEQNPYRFQVLLEEDRDRIFRGVFMVRRVSPSGILPLNASSVEISLMNPEEEIIATGRFPVDFRGNVFFSLEPNVTSLEDPLILNLCVGLFDHGCLGSSLWTFLEDSSRSEIRSDEADPLVVTASNSLDLIREISLDEALTTLTLELQNLEPEVPILVTAEKNQLYFSEIRVPSSPSYSLTIPVHSSLVPELFFTVAQPRGASFSYAMKRISIPRVLKKIPEMPSIQKSKSIVFRLDGRSARDFEERFLASWYPFEGSSIMTTATRSAMVVSEEKKTAWPSLQDDAPVMVIPGTLLSPEESDEIDGQVLIFAEDQEQRFGVFQKEPHSNDLLLSAAMPRFFRSEDEMTVDLELKNQGIELLNLELDFFGKGFQILPQGPIFLGIPPKSSRLYPIRVSAFSAEHHEPTELTIKAASERGEAFSSVRSMLISSGSDVLEKKNRIVKEIDFENSLSVEFMVPATQKLNTMELILAPSPITFILGSLSRLIGNPKYFWKDQVMVGSVLLFLDEMQKKEKDAKTKFLALSDLAERRDILLLPFEDAFWITDALTFAETPEHPIPIDFRKTLMAFWRKKLDAEVPPEGPTTRWFQSKTPEEILMIGKILKSLASLTPSGVPTANLLFTEASSLSIESLLMLLLSFEHYRDYGLSGTSYKIEELTQVLQTRWQEELAISVPTASWSLRALIGQASARLIIPDVLSTLLQKRYDADFQSSIDQYALLSALSSYLKVYREKITATHVQVMMDETLLGSFVMDPQKKFQAFFAETLPIPREQNESTPMRLNIQADTPQPLFIEVNALKSALPSFQSEGISVSVELPLSKSVHLDDRLNGRIVLFSPSSYRHVVVTQEIPAGVADRSEPVLAERYKKFRSGRNRIDYLFEELPEGVTVIPFEWEAKFKGTYYAPPVLVRSFDSSSIRATTGEVVVNID